MTKIEQLYEAMEPFIKPVDLDNLFDAIDGNFCPTDAECCHRCRRCWNKDVVNDD